MSTFHAVDVPVATVRLELPPAALSIAAGRSVIRRIVTFRNSDLESSFLIAFTEILANAVEEHHRLGLDDAIVVEIVQGDREWVCVADSGGGLMIDEHAEVLESVAANGMSERGRGLALAHAFVSEIAFVSSDYGTAATIPLDGFGIVR